MSENDIVITVVLAAVAAFLLFRLRSILGERTGFEDPEKFVRRPGGSDGVVTPFPGAGGAHDPNQPDSDILAYADAGTPMAAGFTAIKQLEPMFSVREFVQGARGAYEMLLSAFEAGDKETLKPYLSPDVFTAFSEAIDERRRRGLVVEMQFVGLETAQPIDVTINESTSVAEISVRYEAEVISVTRNAEGEIVEGDEATARRVSDVWTYSRNLGSQDPNWILTATGE